MGKGKIRKKLQEAKKKIQKVEDKAKKIGKAVIGKAKYAPIIPFAPMMWSILKGKGYKVGKTDLPGLTESFYNNVVKGGNGNYEDQEKLPIPPGAIDLVISTIIAFIKKIKEKKEAGKKLSEEEEAVLDKAKDAAEKIEEELDPEDKSSILNKEIAGFSIKQIGIAIAVLLLLAFLYKKYGK